MAHLYELTGERLALMNKLDSMDFDAETIADTLEGESGELQLKIESYGYVIRNRYALVESMDAEIERMQKRADAERKRVKAIEDWLLQNMVACKISKIECAAFTIAVQNNPPSVVVNDESLIPAELWKTPEPKPPVPAPDKRRILEALKHGDIVPGCSMEQKQRLVMK